MDGIMLRVFAIGAAGIMLTACNTLFPTTTNPDSAGMSHASNDGAMGVMSGEPVENTAPVGGHLASNMDNKDRAKLSKALDNALGKPTKWTNYRTGIKYTVVPVSKSTASGNPFCRNYRVTAVGSGQSQQLSGTACLGSDGAWHPTGG